MWAKEVWPPSSPDCKFLDYSVLGVNKLKVNAAAGNNTEDLNKKMKEVMGFFDRDIMARTCRRFCSWMEAVVAAYGYFTKFVNSQYISLFYSFYFNKIGSFLAVLCPFL